MADERRFPIQGGLTISWTAAERAYRAYVKFGGAGQSLEQLAERGGFGVIEFVILHQYPRLGSPFDNLDRVAKSGALSRGISAALTDGDVRRG